MLSEATLVIAQTPTGPIVRGGPGVAIGTRGEWTLVIDDFGAGRATRDRLASVLDAIEVDPIDAVLRGFKRRALEIFAIIGPPGVIVGSAPNQMRERVVASVDTDDRTVAIGLGAIGISSDWLPMRAGTAVFWGPSGPQAVCSITRGTVAPWSAPVFRLSAAS